MDIILSDISKAFGGKTVITNFSYTFAEGSCTCIMGESGCGKTTLLNIIMGLLPADSGEVSGVLNPVSAVFQEDRLCEAFTPVGNIQAVTGKAKTYEEIISLLGKLELSESVNKPVSALSGGMRRRVAIARALLAESPLLILDEPLKGLDDALRQKVIDVIRSRAKGKTVIIATHDIRDVEAFDAELLNM